MSLESLDSPTDLSGVTDASTQAQYPTIGQFDWADDRYTFDHRILELLSQLNTNLEVYPDDSADTTVGVQAGQAIIGATVLDYAGGTVDLSSYNNDTAYIWLEDDGGASIKHDTDANGWPSTPHLKLAEVPVSDGDIDRDAIVHRRREYAFTAAPAAGVSSLTDNTGGTTDGTLAAVGDTTSSDQSAAINNNFAELNEKLDELLARMQ